MVYSKYPGVWQSQNTSKMALEAVLHVSPEFIVESYAFNLLWHERRRRFHSCGDVKWKRPYFSNSKQARKSGQFQIIANTLEGLQMLWFHGKTLTWDPVEPAETEREKLNLR